LADQHPLAAPNGLVQFAQAKIALVGIDASCAPCAGVATWILCQ
jgi:hypothetical protein